MKIKDQDLRVFMQASCRKKLIGRWVPEVIHAAITRGKFRKRSGRACKSSSKLRVFWFWNIPIKASLLARIRGRLIQVLALSKLWYGRFVEC